MRAKAAFVKRDGLKTGVRLLEDVALVGRICGAIPGLTNRLLGSPRIGKPIKKAMGIHPDRRVPAFPLESFAARAARKGLTKKPGEKQSRKVAYFAFFLKWQRQLLPFCSNPILMCGSQPSSAAECRLTWKVIPGWP